MKPKELKLLNAKKLYERKEVVRKELERLESESKTTTEAYHYYKQELRKVKNEMGRRLTTTDMIRHRIH